MTIEAEDNGRRRRILFLLTESIPDEEDFKGPGPWITGHKDWVPDAPMDLPGDNRFLIANSWTRRIYGPFVQTKPQYSDAEGKVFCRKVWGTPEIFQVTYHNLIEFTKANPEIPVKRGLEWEDIVRLIAVPAASWKQLRKLELTDNEFDTICDLLDYLNQDERDPPITVQQAINELDAEYFFAGDEGSQGEADGDSAYWENYVRDTFFDGDEKLEEAFWESNDPD